MKIKEYRDFFIRELAPLYGPMEAESFFSLVLEEHHLMKRVDLALKPDAEFSLPEVLRWNKILEELKQEIPIQYILGSTFFYGMKFEVNPNVLIPRPETEELIEWILLSHKNIPGLHILDIGTGSGCIAIALGKTLDRSEVTAIDVSEKALETAKKNARANNVEVNFISTDILKTESLGGAYDIIVSNPPYVRMLEKDEIRKNVLENEPHLALFVEDDDALVFYRKIAGLAMDSLQNEGWLYFEINQYLGVETQALLNNLGFKNVELKKDIYENNRMVRAQKL